MELFKRLKQQNGALFEQDFLYSYNRKLLDVFISITVCSLNWSALVKTEPQELLTLFWMCKENKFISE